jgi:alpha-beta hydrolase superfamily lysophospholipase
VWVEDELQELARKTFWGMPITIEQLHGNLKANIHLPPEDGEAPKNKYPAVLLLHGLGGNRHEHGGLFIKTAAALAQAGIVAMRIDFRGAGETGGSTREMTIASQIQDAADALDDLIEIRHVDPERLAVLGLSFGGLTAACLSAQRKDIVAMVLWEPVFDMKATMKKLYGPLSLRSIRSRGYMQAGMLELSESFFDRLDELTPELQSCDFAGRVLLVQGIADAVVPVDTAYQWRRHFRKTETEIHLIENADHAFTHEDWSWQAIDKSVRWLQAVL